MTHDRTEDRKEDDPPPLVPAQEPPSSADTPNAGDEQAAPTAVDPFSRSTLVAGLQAALKEIGIDSRDSPPTAQRTSWLLVTKGGGLTQKIALHDDPNRPSSVKLWAWYWLWSDGLRGEGPATPEYMGPGEDIISASLKIARVLGVNPVAV